MKVIMSKELFDKMCAVILELPAKSVINLVSEIQTGAKIIEEPKQEEPALSEVPKLEENV